MSVITFTYGTDVVTLTGKIVYGTEFWTERKNFIELEMSNGADVVYNGGPDKISGILLMKDVSRSEGDAFLLWLLDVVKLSTNPFTISAVTGVDLGKGINTEITSVRYAGGKTTKDVLKLVPPTKYDITFPYKFLRS